MTRRENLPLLAYSPLAFGHLTGKDLDGVKPPGARLTRFPSFGPRYSKVNVPEAVAAYVALAKSLGLDPATLAVAFVRSKSFVAATIIGATSMLSSSRTSRLPRSSWTVRFTPPSTRSITAIPSPAA